MPSAKRRRTQFDDADPFKIDGVYCKLIPLTRGMYAIVDAADYDWLSKWNWAANPVANSSEFYATRNGCQRNGITKSRIMMHRQILALTNKSSLRADHIDTSATLDNRRKNLRVATIAQNCHNSRKRRTNTSGFKGVSWDNSAGKWVASIRSEGKRTTIGRFNDAIEAHKAYCHAADRLHGEFARTA